MKGITAEQIFPSIKALVNQVQDSSERIKLENLILGAVESRERKKARISANLDRKERYRIKPKKYSQRELLQQKIN